jgi:hypothetical protein
MFGKDHILEDDGRSGRELRLVGSFSPCWPVSSPCCGSSSTDSLQLEKNLR